MARRERPSWPWILFFLGLMLVGLRWRDTDMQSMKDRLLAEADDKARAAANEAFGWKAPVLAAPCAVPIPDGEIIGDTVRCFDVAVPTGTVHGVMFDPEASGLAVVEFLAGPTDAIATRTAAFDAGTRRRRYGDRPVIWIDRRGVGASTLAVCPEVGECAEGLKSAGVTAEALGSREVVQDILRALDGLDRSRFFLAGVGYGAHLALAVAHAAPERVEGVLLDSVVPEPSGRARDRAVELAVRRLFDVCIATEACPAQAEDWQKAWEALPISSPGGVVGLAKVEQALLRALVDPALVGLVPDALGAAARGDGATLARFVDLAMRSSPEASPRPCCAGYLGTLPDSRGTLPVPGLILASTQDPWGTPAAAREMAEALGWKSDRVLELAGRTRAPALGETNGLSTPDRCAESIARAFFDAPEGKEVPPCASESTLSFRRLR